MNVRFYVARMMEGLAGVGHAIGLPSAFGAHPRTTLRLREQHIRFMREARAGDPFTMWACMLELGESSALLYQQIDHADGQPCASFRTWIEHVEAGSGAVLPWSAHIRAHWEPLRGEAPPACAPRSIDLSLCPLPSATTAEADAVMAPEIGRGVIRHQECEPSGIMMPEFFIGRISDSVGHLLRPWRSLLASQAKARGESLRMGGAVLEYRLIYRKWPRAGDRFVIRSGRGFRTEKTHSFVHWVIDPVTGEAFCTSQAVAVNLDLDKRKIVPATPEMIHALGEVAPEGLSI